MATVNINLDDLMVLKGTERTFVASWTISGSKKDKLDKFEWYWYYKTSKGGDLYLLSNGTTEKDDRYNKKDSYDTTYAAPDNAAYMVFKVRAVAVKEKKKVTETDPKTKKKTTKEKEVAAFKTTGWESKTSSAVNKVIVRGWYDIDEIKYDDNLTYPLYAIVSPYKSDNVYDVEIMVNSKNQTMTRTAYNERMHEVERIAVQTGKSPRHVDPGIFDYKIVQKPIYNVDKSWVASYEVTWEFQVRESNTPGKKDNQYVWRTGESTSGIHPGVTQVNYTGTIPDNCTKVRAITKPTAMSSSVKVENKSKDFSFVKNERWVEDLKIGLKSTGNREVIATWTINNVVSLEGFSILFQALDGSTWTNNSESSVSYTTYNDNGGKGPKVWTSEPYTVPEFLKDVRVTVVPTSSDTSGFVETPRTSDTFSYSIGTKEAKGISLSLLANTSRTLVAQWTDENDDSIDSYEYRWSYKHRGSNILFEDSGGSVTHDSSGITPMNAMYTVAADIEVVEFRVRPVPKYSNAFVGVWSAPVTKVFELKSIRLNAPRITWLSEERVDKTLTVQWDKPGTKDGYDFFAKTSGYEVKWRYFLNTRDLGELLQEGETQTISDKDVTTYQFTPNNKATKAQVMVRAIPLEETDFIGEWSEYKTFEFNIEPRSIKPGSLTVDWSQGTDRSLRVGFQMGDESNVQDYTYKYETEVRGIISEPTEGTITRKLFEIEPPEDADTISISIRPNDTSGNSMYFVGQYSNPPVKFNLIPKPRAVQNITLGLQRGSQSTVVATWSIEDSTDVDSYSYKWRYMIDDIWFDAGSEGTTSVDSPACTYDAPTLASMVEVRVKPTPKYAMSFVGELSDPVYFSMPFIRIPDIPDVPSVSIDKFDLTAKVDSYDVKTAYIEFEVVNEDEVDGGGQVDLIFNRATYMQEVEAGHGYRVRARGVNDEGETSEWSQYSSDPVYSTPLPPEGVPVVTALSKNSVEITWEEVAGADSYVIERTNKLRYFDAAPDLVDETTINMGTRAEIQGLEPKADDGSFDGKWFFRIKAVNNSSGESEWGEVASIVLGTKPDPPTTWSSTTTAITSEKVYLNWMHNSEDGSKESEATLELTINGVTETHRLIPSDSSASPTGQAIDAVIQDSELYSEVEHYDIQSDCTVTVDISNILSDDRSNIVVYKRTGLNEESFSEFEELAAGDYVIEEDTLSYTIPANPDAESELDVQIKVKGVESSMSQGTEFAIASSGGISYYVIPANTYDAGAVISWRVKTKGVLPEYGDWSTVRVVNIYAPPTVRLSMLSGDIVMSTTETIRTDIDSSISIDISSIIERQKNNLIVSLQPEGENASELSTTDYEISGDTLTYYRAGNGAATEQYVTYTLRVVNKNAMYSADIDSPEIDGVVESFPIAAKIHSGPETQKPLVYVVSVLAEETYDDLDETGKPIHVQAGEELFKKYIYTDEHDFVFTIAANEINLESSYSYSMHVTVNMDSGLTADTSYKFSVQWGHDDDLEIDATIRFDELNAVAFLSPSCTKEDGSYPPNMVLSVYRKEFDGAMKAICTDIPNGMNVSVTDPHPTLDWGRYRIVATDLETGRMYYEDLAPEPFGVTDIIIQWDEVWDTYETDSPLDPITPSYRGSFLRLLYNIDESDSNDLDIELVNYIGRKHPVSYYGTHVGQTASWKTEIPKYDKETIYALRRLAVWPGDVYVRSPSGVGYWAHVNVSFDVTHLELTVPISLDITRVEGGV